MSVHIQMHNLSLNPWGQISQASPLELIEHFLHQTLKAAAPLCVYVHVWVCVEKGGILWMNFF